MTKEDIKNKVYNSCPYDHKCEKEFTQWSLLEQDGDKMKIVSCPCALKVEKHYRYATAGIENEFWNFTFDDLSEDFDQTIITKYAKVFIDKTKECIENKVCLYFYGVTGSGTTTIAVLILKTVLEAGYKGIIITARDLISRLYSKDNTGLKELYVYDFLVVDGVDKLTENVMKNFSLEASELMDKKSVIFTSSLPVKKLNGAYHKDFINRISNIPEVRFPDVNFREEFKSRFEAVEEL